MWRENRIFFPVITPLKIGKTKCDTEVRRAVTLELENSYRIYS